MKMNNLYSALYSDGRTEYERPLEWIYQNQNGARVEIRPCIWLWKNKNIDMFFVDYIGRSVGCTLAAFDDLKAAERFRDEVGAMEKADFGKRFFNVAMEA